MPDTGRYLLDTHVIIGIGIVGGIDAMPIQVRRILENPQVEKLLSVASEIEIAIKNQLGKLGLNRIELAAICTKALVTSYPIRREHSDRLFDLPLHHKDPFDRLIIATALSEDLPVISSDRIFAKYKGLRVVW